MQFCTRFCAAGPVVIHLHPLQGPEERAAEQNLCWLLKPFGKYLCIRPLLKPLGKIFKIPGA